jgi:2-polyprenyl-3-methyl-5-hydroxy-6-metoxy-1,4-benzoquinol methylase
MPSQPRRTYDNQRSKHSARREALASDWFGGQSSVTTDHAVQDFWLQNLLKADAFTRWVVDEISPWLGQQILEVGCGIGTYTAVLADGTRKIVAMDMEREFVEEATRRVGHLPNVEVIYGDATRMDVRAPNQGTFDTIILLDVLEHIENDVALLERLRARLSPGGHLILKVPAMPSLYSPMDQAIGHWRRYDKKGLRNVFRRAGLDVVEVNSFNAFAVPGWWLNGRILKRRAPPGEQIAFFNLLIPFLRPLDRIVRLCFGASLVGIGRLPTL